MLLSAHPGEASTSPPSQRALIVPRLSLKYLSFIAIGGHGNLLDRLDPLVPAGTTTKHQFPRGCGAPAHGGTQSLPWAWCCFLRPASFCCPAVRLFMVFIAFIGTYPFVGFRGPWEARTAPPLFRPAFQAGHRTQGVPGHPGPVPSPLFFPRPPSPSLRLGSGSRCSSG